MNVEYVVRLLRSVELSLDPITQPKRRITEFDRRANIIRTSVAEQLGVTVDHLYEEVHQEVELKTLPASHVDDFSTWLCNIGLGDCLRTGI